MRMRSVVGLLGLAAVLAGCSGPGNEDAPNVPPLVSVPTTETPTPTPTPTPSDPATSKVADTLCTRMDQTLVRTTLGVPVVEIQPKQLPADFGLPTYDVCQLALSAAANGPVLRMEVSVLPATKTELAAAQKAYAATRAEPAKPVTLGAGGFGTSRFVVFLLGGRLVKVSGPPATLAKYVVLGQEAVRQAPGLPDPAPVIARPECERGTTKAAKVMGAPAIIRRDSETSAGDPVCGWITATGVLYTTARRVTDAEAAMVPIRKAPTSMSVPLGDEGYVDTTTGRGTIRVGTGKLVDLIPIGIPHPDPDTMVAFALSINGLYTR
ncbi:hypothetical protein [Kribbella monticola]|uniref:hypothetical protein n=1 Tax=Kribbella monticola TaxID=2185285 RepID=UPI001300A8F0|nr:hypothetical protein [Kribbella monticola]